MRRQLLVFAAAAALPVVVIPTGFGVGLPQWVFGACLLPLPVAVAVAILTGGMFDLATVGNRAMVWSALSLAVVAIYALVIASVGSMFHDPGAAWVSWLAAAVVAIAFAPMRDVLQVAVNRVTYGRWREPYGVLASLGQRVEAAADVDRLLGDVVAELRSSLGLADVALLDAHGALVAGVDATGERQAIGLSAYGRPVGSLTLAQPRTPLRAADRRLLDDLAAQLGSLLHAHALTSDLQRARERLVLTREEERRRLRRDLHDGLGPALAGLMLKAETARALVAPDPGRAAERLETLRDDLHATVADVRRLVEGLRPPALDELGLASAIDQAVAQLGIDGPKIVIDIPADLPALPAAVEVAMYRIICEAVTNSVRHSRASRCEVSARLENDAVVARIADDGEDALEAVVRRRGHGLETMRERAEELGGEFQIVRAGGTAVTARLPIRDRASAVVIA